MQCKRKTITALYSLQYFMHKNICKSNQVVNMHFKNEMYYYVDRNSFTKTEILQFLT